MVSKTDELDRFDAHSSTRVRRAIIIRPRCRHFRFSLLSSSYPLIAFVSSRTCAVQIPPAFEFIGIYATQSLGTKSRGTTRRRKVGVGRARDTSLVESEMQTASAHYRWRLAFSCSYQPGTTRKRGSDSSDEFRDGQTSAKEDFNACPDRERPSEWLSCPQCCSFPSPSPLSLPTSRLPINQRIHRRL